MSPMSVKLIASVTMNELTPVRAMIQPDRPPSSPLTISPSARPARSGIPRFSKHAPITSAPTPASWPTARFMCPTDSATICERPTTVKIEIVVSSGASTNGPLRNAGLRVAKIANSTMIRMTSSGRGERSSARAQRPKRESFIRRSCSRWRRGPSRCRGRWSRGRARVPSSMVISVRVMARSCGMCST